MFRASSAHLQEDTVVHMQHMVLSLSVRIPGVLSVHSLSENWLWGEKVIIIIIIIIIIVLLYFFFIYLSFVLI